MNENNGYGGFVGLLVLLIVFGMWGGNGWGGNNGWGNGNTAATATETAALVQQDNLRSQVSGIQSTVNYNHQFLTGMANGIDRLQAQVAEQDTKLCQLGNNISSQFTAAQFANQQQFCSLKRDIIDNRLALENKLNAQAVAALQEKADMYKQQLERQTLMCSQNEQTNTIVNAIERNGGGVFPGACGGPFPGNPGYQAQMLSALQTIAAGVTTTNNTLTALSNTATSNTATLAEILSKVSTTTS